MQVAYERFLAAAGLAAPTAAAPLMVSRLAAARPALVRSLDGDTEGLTPGLASTLSYEFRRATVADVARALTGVTPGDTGGPWDDPYSPERLMALFRHADGEPVAATLRAQAGLFARHLRNTARNRPQVILVDTGLYGTTRALISEGMPDLDVSSALIARSFRPGTRHERTFGLSVQADGYSPLRRRTALLRYWHFVEWLFEPPLPTVRTFDVVDGRVVSNLEVDGWRDCLAPEPASAFAGVLAYLDGLTPASAPRVMVDTDRAWRAFRRAVVWPHREHGHALQIGGRSSDFGVDTSWSARSWSGPLAALRGSSMWREGEIARSGTSIRGPLLAAVEAAHGARRVKRVLTRRDL
jgi:hypothetical protein